MFKETLVGAITFFTFVLGVLIFPKIMLLALCVVFLTALSYMIGCLIFETRFGE